jgi:hypothetical protein
VFVVGGTWLYWRTAAAVTVASGAEPRRARVAAIAMALSGVITLGLNVAGQ